MSYPGRHPLDDPSIDDAVRLLRRVPPGPTWVAGERLSSGTFKARSHDVGASVVLEDELLRSGRPLEAVLSGHPGFGLVAVSAGQVRALGAGVRRVPLPDEPAHAELVGVTGGISKRLAGLAEWIRWPEL